jgi:hypothetical protein
MFTSFEPKSQARFVKVFGPEPFGMTASHFAALLFSILFLPLVWLGYHFAMIIIQGRRDGMAPGGFLSILEADRLHPGLRRSKRICVAGLFYFFALAVAWIIFTGVRKI